MHNFLSILLLSPAIFYTRHATMCFEGTPKSVYRCKRSPRTAKSDLHFILPSLLRQCRNPINQRENVRNLPYGIRRRKFSSHVVMAFSSFEMGVLLIIILFLSASYFQVVQGDFVSIIIEKRF